MKVYTLDCADDGGGVSIGVFSSKVRALAALRHATGKKEFINLRRESSEYNPDYHQFYTDDDDGTRYRIVSFEMDHHV